MEFLKTFPQYFCWIFVQVATPDRDWDLWERTRYSGDCRDTAQAWSLGDSAVLAARLDCYLRYRQDSSFRARAVVESKRVLDAEDCARECDFSRGSSSFQCNAFAFSVSVGRYQDNCVLSDSYGRNIDVDLQFERDFDVYEYSGEGGRCRAGAGGAGGAVTVNGARCLRGGCRLNPDVNYWYCETDEALGWDYCCRPEHRCGYSEGFQ